MKENAGFLFSHYAPAGGCVCWYCGTAGTGFARYQVGTSRASYYAPLVPVLAEVCADCTPRAERGERGNA